MARRESAEAGGTGEGGGPEGCVCYLDPGVEGRGLRGWEGSQDKQKSPGCHSGNSRLRIWLQSLTVVSQLERRLLAGRGRQISRSSLEVTQMSPAPGRGTAVVM